MAEGFLTNIAAEAGKDIAVYSAGIETHGLNPHAVTVMEEVGIDISSNESNHVDAYLGIGITHLISVCDHALENCPVFPEDVNRVHHTFRDPANVTGSDEDILNAFRVVRNEIDIFCKGYLADL